MELSDTADGMHCRIGIPANIVLIIAMWQIRNTIGKSAIVYYIAIAIGDINILLWRHVLNMWIENAIATVAGTRDTLYIARSSAAMCKFSRFIWFASETTSNWSLTVFSMEKLVAISNPLKTRGIFTQRRAILSVLACLFFGCVLGSIEATVESVQVTRGVVYTCAESGQYPTLEIVQAYMTTFVMFLLPTTIALGTNVGVIASLVRNAKQHDLSASRISRQSGKEKEACIIVIIISLIHCLFYLPASVAFAAYITYADLQIDKLRGALGIHVQFDCNGDNHSARQQFLPLCGSHENVPRVRNFVAFVQYARKWRIGKLDLDRVARHS